VDQRGVDRPQDGKLPDGAECDIGSFEREPNAELVVDSTTDAVDAAPGNGRCQTAGGVCTLRAAVQEANAQPGEDEILFSPDLDGLPITLTIAGNDDTAAAGDLDVNEFLRVGGNGRLVTIIRGCDDGDGTVDCAGVDRLFDITNGVQFEAEAVTLRRGNTGGGGAAIRQNGGVLVLEQVELRNNTAGGVLLNGAGAVNAVGGTLVIVDVTFADNTAEGFFDDRYGAGLFINGSNVLVLRTAFLNNVVDDVDADIGHGGGVYAHAGTINMTNVTFDGNSAPNGGSAVGNGTAALNLSNVTVTGSVGAALTGAMTVKNSIISGSTNLNCNGLAKTMQGMNVVSDASCGAAGPTIIIGDPGLSGLAENGGWPLSRKPLTGSPAIDAVT
jgi:CSLREA domain-containing protein